MSNVSPVPFVIVHHEPHSVAARLADLGKGLNIELMQEVATAWDAGMASAPPFGSIMGPGWIGWNLAVSRLREALSLHNWSRSDPKTLPLTTSPGGGITIAVTGGDMQTGIAEGKPTTRNSKGRFTLGKVRLNADQLAMKVVEMIEYVRRTSMQTKKVDRHKLTWVLLVHIDAKEIRAELSLPSEITGRVITGFRERLIIPAVPRHPAPGVKQDAPANTDDQIDVPLERDA